MKKGARLLVLGAVLVVVDQVVKQLVLAYIPLHSGVSVIGDFFRLLYVQNEGMAFGLKVGGTGAIAGKLVLSVFRIVLSVALIWWISKLRRREDTPTGVLVGLTMIAAGAVGNVIDCCFYGIINPDLLMQGAPFGLFFGKVVDMFAFSIFPPVFNFADSCVTVGAFYLIIFQWKFFSEPSANRRQASE